MVNAAGTHLYLTVLRGPDAGARLLVDASPRIIGRARGADLVLTDIAVSRRHLNVRLDQGLVRIAICEKAAPFLLRGILEERAGARTGDEIIIGNTVLSVIEADERSAASDTGLQPVEITHVKTLFDGATAEVRGLSAIFSLIEELDAAVDHAGVERVLSDWSRRSASAAAGRLVPLEEPEAEGGRLIVRAASDQETTITVPAGGGLPWGTEFRIAMPLDRVTDTHRRLLAIAGRVVASSLERLRALGSVEEENQELRRMAVGSAKAFLGSSPAAEQVAKILPKLAASDACVLLLGESGTGKTFAARLIHEMGPRARAPLRVINCAAIPEHLVESELFGHERGAFTGAVAARAGVFEAAGRGTVLLDEIGELPLTSQAKLLRVLEDKRFERLGSNRSLKLEARVLAATNRDLEAMAEAGRFRRDLFFRVSVINLKIPPLRERGGDVGLLARQILADIGAGAGRRVRDFSPAAMSAILGYGWPGNVRELRNAIEHALVLGDGPIIEPGDLPDAVRAARPSAASPSAEHPDVIKLPASLEWIEGRAIEAALRATGGNRTRAAALLGINRITLYKKLRESPDGR